jgi:hypothetical protein
MSSLSEKLEEYELATKRWENVSPEWGAGRPALEVPKGWVPEGDNALNKQVGGKHYASMKIQPVEFIAANELGFLEGNVVKYICRHHAKNGAEDIKKAIHYCELLLQTKYGGENERE